MGAFVTRIFDSLFIGINVDSECQCYNNVSDDNEFIENKNRVDENDGPKWMMEKHFSQTAQDKDKKKEYITINMV